MAIGDVISSLANVAGFAFLTFQPAGTSEWAVLEGVGAFWIGVVPDCAYDAYLALRVGAINSNYVGVTINTYAWNNLRAIISNATYLRLYNNAAAAQVLGGVGLITK